MVSLKCKAAKLECNDQGLISAAAMYLSHLVVYCPHCTRHTLLDSTLFTFGAKTQENLNLPKFSNSAGHKAEVHSEAL